MKRFAGMAVVLMLLVGPALAENVTGGAASADKPVFRVDLLNGSSVSGTLTQGDIKLQTKYGVLTLPLGDLKSIMIGLDNRPDLAEAVDTEVNALKSPDEAARFKTEKALIERGPAIRLLLESYLAKTQDPNQKKHLQSAIAALQAKEKETPAVLIRTNQFSEVQSSQVSAGGRITNETLTIKTEYSEFTIAPADIDKITRLNAVAPLNPPKAGANQIKAELSDGSILLGETDGSIKLQALGKPVELPIKSIRFLTLSADKAQVTLINGDRLAGTLLSEKLNIKTLVGDLAIPMKNVRQFGRTNDLGKGLLTLWSGEGNAKDSVGNYSGQINGNVTFVPGKVGQAFHFDGSSYLNLGDIPPARLTGDMTLSLWIRPDRLGTRQNPWNKSSTAEGAITLEPDGGLTYYYGPPPQGRPEGLSIPYPYPMPSPPPENLVHVGQWTHIVLARHVEGDKITFTWHINGTLTRRDNYIGRVNASNSPLYLGTGYAGAYAGSIDEVAVWDRPLSEEEAKDLYQMQADGMSLIPSKE